MSFENENELVGAQLLHPCRLHLLDPSQCDLEYNGNGSAHGEDGNGRGDDGHLGQLALLHRLHLLDLVQRDLGYNGHGGVHDGVHGSVHCGVHGGGGNGGGDDGHLGQLALLHRLHLLDLSQRYLGYNGHGGVHDGVHGSVHGGVHGGGGNGGVDDGHLGQLAPLHRLHLLDLAQCDLGYNSHGGVHDGVYGSVRGGVHGGGGNGGVDDGHLGQLAPLHRLHLLKPSQGCHLLLLHHLPADHHTCPLSLQPSLPWEFHPLGCPRLHSSSERFEHVACSLLLFENENEFVLENLWNLV